MKITDFDILSGVKIRRKSWPRSEYYVYSNMFERLKSCNDDDFYMSYRDIIADDWEEYKEPIDYGARDNPKLYLFYGEMGNYWVEGWQPFDNAGMVVLKQETGKGFYPTFDKSKVLKVIDLPSKEQ